jgi:NTP pyrophosphatase (non-canonical NTP hydrolase)
MKKTINSICNVARLERKPAWALGLKLFEEAGEAGEALNHHLGMLPHKQMKEPIEGEIADVVQNAIAILVKVYPNLSNKQLRKLLKAQIKAKNKKWKAIITE